MKSTGLASSDAAMARLVQTAATAPSALRYRIMLSSSLNGSLGCEIERSVTGSQFIDVGRWRLPCGVEEPSCRTAQLGNVTHRQHLIILCRNPLCALAIQNAPQCAMVIGEQRHDLATASARPEQGARPPEGRAGALVDPRQPRDRLRCGASHAAETFPSISRPHASRVHPRAPPRSGTARVASAADGSQRDGYCSSLRVQSSRSLRSVVPYALWRKPVGNATPVPTFARR